MKFWNVCIISPYVNWLCVQRIKIVQRKSLHSSIYQIYITVQAYGHLQTVNFVMFPSVLSP